MDNLSSVRNDTGALKEATRDAQTWIISFLYIGTFGSFIGYSFAFGLVLQNQFGRTPVQAAAVTFIGPLLGSLIRPLGGMLSDRIGGVRVTFWNFVGMAVATVVCIDASGVDSLAMFTIGFVLLFITSGIGNGSVYKMIPAIFRTKAPRLHRGAGLGHRGGAAVGPPDLRRRHRHRRRDRRVRRPADQPRVPAVVPGRRSSGTPAFWAFLAFYAVCFVVTYVVYMRRPPAATDPRTGDEGRATRRSVSTS